MSGRRKRQGGKKGRKAKNAESSSSSAEEDLSTSAQGQPSTLAEVLADALSEKKAQSASNESVPSETSGAVSWVLERQSEEAQKLRDENAALKRKLQRKQCKDQEIRIQKLICEETQSLCCSRHSGSRVPKSVLRRDGRRAILFESQLCQRLKQWPD